MEAFFEKYQVAADKIAVGVSGGADSLALALRLNDWAKKNGKKIFMHSDGYIIDIIPDLIELGLDAVEHDAEMVYRAVPHRVIAQADDVVVESAFLQLVVISMRGRPVLGVLRVYYYLRLGAGFAACFYSGA